MSSNTEILYCAFKKCIDLTQQLRSYNIKKQNKWPLIHISQFLWTEDMFQFSAPNFWWRLLFSGDAKIDLYASSSHSMISEPIKRIAFWLEFFVLNRSLTVALPTFLPEKTYVVLCKIQLKILWKEKCKNIY